MIQILSWITQTYQLEKMRFQDHHKFHDTRDQWEYARNKVVKEYHQKKSKKANK